MQSQKFNINKNRHILRRQGTRSVKIVLKQNSVKRSATLILLAVKTYSWSPRKISLDFLLLLYQDKSRWNEDGIALLFCRNLTDIA
jgi:hypothetical protein